MKEIIKTEYGSQIGPVEFIWARNSKEFLFANSILVKGSPSYIIDPSATFTYIEQLATSHTVDIVLNTHYHGDHRALNSLFSNVIYASHANDSASIRDYEIYEKNADTDSGSFYTYWRKEVFKKYHIVDCPVSKLFKDGDIVETDSTQFEIVHVPGHTPGHIAIHFKDINCLYLSDIDLTPLGPWYANVVSNIDDFKASVRRVQNIEADYYITSHGERIFTPEKFQEKITRYYNYFNEREEKILELLKSGPKEMLQIASEGIVYRKMALNDPLKAYFQWQMILKHLEEFIKNGVVGVGDGKYFLK